MGAMDEPGKRQASLLEADSDRDPEEIVGTTDEPTLEGAFSDDGVERTLMRWMLQKSPIERLRAAQDLIDATWQLRSDIET